MQNRFSADYTLKCCTPTGKGSYICICSRKLQAIGCSAGCGHLVSFQSIFFILHAECRVPNPCQWPIKICKAGSEHISHTGHATWAPCLIEMALLRPLVVRPDPCIVSRQKAAVVLAVPALLLQAKYLRTSPIHSASGPLQSAEKINLPQSRKGVGAGH